ncbi:MAG: hypothetical protein Fur0023_04230 [Bacteroidia bacterium]
MFANILPAMNLLKILILSIFVNTSNLTAQLLLHPEYIFEKFPVFDETFIKNNQIKTITFQIIDKKDWQEAEDKKLTEVYEFYPNGKLKRQYHTSVKKIIQYETINKKNKNVLLKEQYEYDTTSVSYIYDKNLIIERFKFPNNYTEANYHKLCGQYVCKEEKYIESYRQLQTGNFIPDKMLLKAQDSIATFVYARQIKQIFYNNEKLPYKEKFIYKDEQNRIYEITEQFIAAQGKIKKTFHYNADNLLDNATMTIDYGTPETYTIEYFYDGAKQLFSEKHLKNNTAMKEYQYIYDEKTKLLKSILIRTFEDKNIRIIKLIYE